MITIFMETNNEENLLKVRSARGAVSAGFRLYLGNFRRIFRATWICMLVFALVSGVAEAMLVTYYPVLVIAPMLLWYVVYRLLMRCRLTMLPVLKGAFTPCLRHAGLLFVVALIAFLLCATAWLLTSVPAVILGIANMQAEAGALYGDPLGMPDYMIWLTIAVFTLASFMQGYIYLAFFFPLHFAQGSAVASEAERSKALKIINDEKQ
jgi:hypothetical protein